MTARLPDQLDVQPERAATRPSRVRRYTLIGLSAGLLGGAAVGLTATSPLASQAAELPQLVVAPDPTDDVAPDPRDDDAPARRGDRLREVLQPLVDDGTLTAEQVEAVVATLQDAGPLGRLGHRGPDGDRRPHRLLDREELAAVLGIDVDALSDQLRDGMSLAAIAEQQGVAVDVVIDLLVADAEARLADRVADGTLTEEQAADRAAEIRERVTELVNRVPGERPERPEHAADEAPVPTPAG